MTMAQRKRMLAPIELALNANTPTASEIRWSANRDLDFPGCHCNKQSGRQARSKFQNAFTNWWRLMPIKPAIGLVAIAVLFFCARSIAVQAAENPSFEAEILQLSHDWEGVKFQVVSRDEREKQMAALAAHANDIALRYQHRSEAIIWVGIITSEQASMASENGSPLKALSFAKRARDILEHAEKVEPVALDAAAPTTLGVLYDRVPGFPIGFGDKSKARRYLQEAIVNAPNGLDANYFYGDFLYKQHEYPEAVKILQHALMLPVLASRPIWDQSCRAAIRDLLMKMQSNTGL